MKYYFVSLDYGNNVYGANIAHAENIDDVSVEYSAHKIISVREAADHEVEAAKAKGMPIVECPHRSGYDNATFTEKMAAALIEAAEVVKAPDFKGGPKISHGNSKMGEVPSVSLLPIATCPTRCHGRCASVCYAAKLANMRPAVLKAYAYNTALALYRPDLYWLGVFDAIAASRFFRFHVSGDILAGRSNYFEHMVLAARIYPHCEILAFTKRFEVVNDWIEENGPLPENLHIIFSGWQDMPVPNPHNLPMSQVIFKGCEPDPSWKQCGGNCLKCGCRGIGCWTLAAGETVAFKKH